MTHAGSEQLWGVVEVARYLQVPAASIYKMTQRRARLHIPHIRLGGKLRFRPSDIDKWLDLLTVSNLETLSKLKRSVANGYHPSTQAP